MRTILGTIVLLVVAGTAGVAGQQPRTMGFYAGASMGEIAQFHFPGPRVGMNYSTPLIGPVEFYPGLDIIPENYGGTDVWQANIYLRVWPLRRGGKPSFWFVGAGVVAKSSGADKAIMSGLTLPFGKYRPFIQLQWYGWPHGASASELVGGFFLSI